MMKSLYHWINSSYKYKNSYFNSFKLKLIMFFKGCLALIFYRKNISEPIECDVLLIHPSLKSYKQGRKKKFINMLKNKGLVVEEFIERKDKDIIFKRQFCKVEKIPFFFKWDAYHASYILNKYRAKVILTERNGWVIPSFIKKLRGEGSIVVHMAHSIPTGQSSKYNYYDYDFYLLYGESSYVYLSSLNNCFGSCNVLFKGPYFFYSNRKYCRKHVGKSIVFLGSGPDYENNENYIKVCRWVEKLVENNIVDKLYLKGHPRSTDNRWLDFLEKNPEKVSIVSDDNLQDTIDNSVYAVMAYTNAIVDMAYYGVPIIMMGESTDYFNLDSFYVPWAKNYSDLVSIVSSEYQQLNAEFISYHVENPINSSQSIVDFVTELTINKNVLLENVNKKLYSGF